VDGKDLFEQRPGQRCLLALSVSERGLAQMNKSSDKACSIMEWNDDQGCSFEEGRRMLKDKGARDTRIDDEAYSANHRREWPQRYPFFFSFTDLFAWSSAKQPIMFRRDR
jgi:hypothetical protein